MAVNNELPQQGHTSIQRFLSTTACRSMCGVGSNQSSSFWLSWWNGAYGDKFSAPRPMYCDGRPAPVSSWIVEPGGLNFLSTLLELESPQWNVHAVVALVVAREGNFS